MNFSIILKIFREGIIAALMGGFYIDFSEDYHFINIVHLYLWLTLFISPILIVMNYPNSITVMISASVGVGLLVLILKLITNHLHYLFDTSEAIEVVKNQDVLSKDENELMMNPLSFQNDSHTKITAMDQESMFHNGSVEDVENGVSIRNMDRHTMTEERAQINVESEQRNECNLEKNRSTDFCILDQASRRPSVNRVLSRISSARARMVDIRKHSLPLGPNQLIIPTTSTMNDKYSRLMNPRNTFEFYQSELEKMKREISQLPIVVKHDFVPSTADLSMLDLHPTSRKVVKSISRSRSSSQRHCHSVHINHATRVGSVRTNNINLADMDQTGKTLNRMKSQRRQSVCSTRSKKPLTEPVARSNSLKQGTHIDRNLNSFSSSSQMRRRVSANIWYPNTNMPMNESGRLPGRRTQSFRNEDRLNFVKPIPTRLEIKSNHMSQMQVTVNQNGDLIRRKSSFTNQRRQMRAASIDVPGLLKPVFTLGNEDILEVKSTKSSRKGSLDMKSRSLEVPVVHLESYKTMNRAPFYKQNSFCSRTDNQCFENLSNEKWLLEKNEEGQSEFVENIPEKVATELSQANLSEFDAMLAAQLSMEDDEIDALLQPKQHADIDECSIQDNFNNEEINDNKRRNAINRGRPNQSDVSAFNPNIQGDSTRNVDFQVISDKTLDSKDASVVTQPLEGLNPASHEDTSEGSVHLFQNESGQWMVYVFGDDKGTAIPRRDYLEGILSKSPTATIKEAAGAHGSSKSIEDSANVIKKDISRSHRCDSPHPDMLFRKSTRTLLESVDALEETELPGTSNQFPEQMKNFSDNDSVLRNRRTDLQGRISNASIEQISMLDRILMTDNTRGINNDQFDFLQSMLGSTASPSNPDNMLLYDAIEKWFCKERSQLSTKHYYYELALIPWSSKRFRVDFDRLQLTSLFDRSMTKFEIILAVLLSFLVSLIGLSVICRDLYYDMSLFLVCFTMASAQYSLLKSVQPDACSPQHGFNRILVFNRAVYFCLIAGLILILELILDHKLMSDKTQYKLFYIPVIGVTVLRFISDTMQYVLLLLPLLHTLGMLPQLNTLLLYVLEHVDIHLFGSSGSIDIVSAATSLFRNVMGIVIVYPLCFFGLKHQDPQNILFSIFWGLHLAMCYFLGRLPNNIHLYRFLVTSCSTIGLKIPLFKGSPQANLKNKLNCQAELITNIEGRQEASTVLNKFSKATPSTNFNDPLPQFLQENLLARVKNDIIICFAWAVLGFALHISTFFTHNTLQSIFKPVIIYTNVIVGFSLHYLWPQLRKPYPWLIFTQPFIKTSDVGRPTKAEGCHYWFLWLYKNILIPVLTMAAFISTTKNLNDKFNAGLASVFIIVFSMKLLRMGFSASPRLYLVILLTHLLFEYDFKHLNISETFPLNFILVSILFSKLYELWLKMNFVFIYIAPFQISWGSAFHAVAQLAFLPHSMFMIFQCVLSSIFSAPLEPFLASAIFLCSYFRPIKFWEQKYRTQRLETTNTALSSQVQGVSSEQVTGNLNSIFYEHLTRSLQKTLAGDLLLGRWGGAVENGDMFILASEDLHFLVHIIEVGNGLVTFQLRGLEFAGTYCHEQETEELRTDLIKNRGLCCCNPGRLPWCLSLNVAFRLRWVAWEFVQSPFVIDGYRVSDHSATTTMQLYELRKLIVTLYVQCIIYYTVKMTDLSAVITKLKKTLTLFGSDDFADLDPIFNKAFDDDFDEQINGVTRSRFLSVYGEWMKYCINKETGNKIEIFSSDMLHKLNSFCFALSILGRRSLGYTSSDKSFVYQQSLTDVFLHGLHDVFKGDVRVSKDDWVFEEVTLLQSVITPAVRVALKLYQDNLANPLTDISDLHGAIEHTENTHVICHETEPQWRFAILNDSDSLFSFRRIVKPNSGDGYRIIMFNKKSLQFKVIKINRECVRGLWSSQQREQIFLRNNDQERGSIQHARQVLRNLVNSSCDLPIGYPIYVSPLTTSMAGSHLDLRGVSGRELSLARMFTRLKKVWHRLRYRCTESCVPRPTRTHLSKSDTVEMTKIISPQCTSSSYKYFSSAGVIVDSSDDKAASTVKQKLMIDPLSSGNRLESVSEGLPKLYKIVDSAQVLDRWHDKLSWPVEEWKSRIITARTSPMALQGLKGYIVHRWTPFNPTMSSRSFCHLTIVLMSFSNITSVTNITDKFLLIFEKGVMEIPNDDEYNNVDFM